MIAKNCKMTILNSMKILITGGGCREAIDGVRFVTNMSTGRTAAFLADALAEKGAQVTAVMAHGALLPKRAKSECSDTHDSGCAARDSKALHPVRLIRFESGAELSAALQTELTRSRAHGEPYTAIVHAAAVSDFIPDMVSVDGVSYPAGRALRKLHSGGSMTVTFRAAPKIADNLRDWAGAGTVIFCCKLTNGATADEQRTAVHGLFSHSAADYVIANDLSQLSAVAHPFTMFARDGNTVAHGATLDDLVHAVAERCQQE